MRKLREDQRNGTTDQFFRLNRAIFLISSMNFWVEDVASPEIQVKSCQFLAKIFNVAAYLFIGFEWGAFFTQHSLTEKQKADRFLMSFTHTIAYSFILVIIRRKERVRELLFTLAVTLKRYYNDEEVEKKMMKRTKFYVGAFAVICGNALVWYGVDGLIEVIYSDGTFVTLIPFWPDVHDHRAVASAARVAVYVFWWVMMMQITAAYMIVFPVTICLSHQFINLQHYFKSLEDIFQKTNLSQRVKEEKYEKALKVGVKLHATTLWCTQQVEDICGPAYSGQIVVNITVLVLLMSQMVNADRTLSNLLPIVTTMASLLFSTGVIMCNAGDVTVEATHLSTAMFLSGWQHCQGNASYRIRRVLLVAIAQSQKSVVFRCFGVIELSYQSFLSIVKTSYSIFSVLY